MLFSRAGEYPPHQPRLHAEDFSPNTPQGACPACHGLGRIYDATEASMVPNDRLPIRERAIAEWPPASHGQNLRDIAVTLGYDVDTPWRKLSRKDRNWLLFTDEHPTVPVYAGYEPHEVRRAVKRKEEPSYMGTFTGARNYVLHTFAHTDSALMKKRVSRYLVNAQCAACGGQGLRPEALTVTFAGMNITAVTGLPLVRLADVLRERLGRDDPGEASHPETTLVASRIGEDMLARIEVLLDLGLGYLALDRSTPTLSPGELQRLRLATQVRSHLFGVVYVLDEPSAGLHPVDTQALLRALDRLKAAGKSLFVIEHDLDVIRHADWICRCRTRCRRTRRTHSLQRAARRLRTVTASKTRLHLYPTRRQPGRTGRQPRTPRGWLTRNNLRHVDVEFPIGVITTVTGVSGSGKSSLVSQAVVDLVRDALGHVDPETAAEPDLEREPVLATAGTFVGRQDTITRLVCVDRRPIGRTPRSNLATYTGLFDHVRKLFAATRTARARRYDAGRFSFNVAKGRCPRCVGEGFVTVELLFLPSVYTPCPVCGGARYNAETLEVQYRGKSIADVLALTVDEPGTSLTKSARSDTRSMCCGKSASDTFVLGSQPRNCPAARCRGSNSPQNCSEADEARLSTSLTSRRLGCTPLMLRNCWSSWIVWSTRETRYWWSSTTWASSARVTGSSTSDLALGTRVAGWWSPARRMMLRRLAKAAPRRFCGVITE